MNASGMRRSHQAELVKLNSIAALCNTVCNSCPNHLLLFSKVALDELCHPLCAPLPLNVALSICHTYGAANERQDVSCLWNVSGVYARMHVCMYASMPVCLHVCRPVRLHVRMYATSA